MRGVRRLSQTACGAGVLIGAAGLIGALAAPAAADVVSPPGKCVASGAWQEAGFTKDSTQLQPGDTIKIPKSDTVAWSGSLPDQAGGALDAVSDRRDISGKVEIKLPPPLGWVTIDDWDKTSVRVANEGEHAYDLPDVLGGISLELHGVHNENGQLYCEASVKVEIDGDPFSNPLTYVGLGGLAISGGALFFAGRPAFKKLRAYEDINPG